MTVEAYRCGRCGEAKRAGEFSPSQRGNGKWCRLCMRNWYVERQGGMQDRSCDQCGTVMAVTARRARESRVFCSRKCKTDHKNAAWAAANEALKPAERVCPHCGVTFGREKRADAKFCSQKCEQAAHNQFRKAVRRGASDPDRGVSMARVMTRCKGRCHICGKKAVDPTLDHIIPVSLGGSHTEDNLAIACLSCNCARGNRFLN